MSVLSIENKKVDIKALTEAGNLAEITELKLKDCITDTSALWPVMPKLRKVTLEYCRGEAIFRLCRQINIAEIQFFRCDYQQIDLSNLCLKLSRLSVKQCRNVTSLVGLDNLDVVNLVVSRCRKLVFPFTQPAITLETLGWREMVIDTLPVELVPNIKWLDLTQSQLVNDPDLEKLPNLRSIRLQYTERNSTKPFVVPSHVPNIVADKDQKISFDFQSSRIVVPSENKYRPGDKKSDVKSFERHAKHPQSFKRRNSTPRVDSVPVQDVLFKEQDTSALFPTKYLESQVHQVYLEKVKNENWTDFTKDEFAHFLSVGPNHAMVRLGLVTKYKVTKRIMKIKEKVLKSRPDLANVTAKAFKL